MSDLSKKRAQLLASLRALESCAVALSGGVDSAVVAKAAVLALGERAVAVTADSPSLPAGELRAAQQLAAEIGMRHEVLATDELASPDYVRNAPDRCYFCKTELYTVMAKTLRRLGVATLVNGANADDLGDHRPGMRAAAEHEVHSPLAECGITKEEVRALALEWELSVWDKPAGPCLASRIAYGEEVTAERLHMIDQAEIFLRELGVEPIRVRWHRGDTARIEAPLSALVRICQDETRRAVCERLRELGFTFVTLDLEGFRSGSLNALVPVEELQIVRPQ